MIINALTESKDFETDAFESNDELPLNLMTAVDVQIPRADPWGVLPRLLCHATGHWNYRWTLWQQTISKSGG